MVGEKFKIVRKQKKLTLDSAAKALGLKSTGHLSQIERGEKEPSSLLINNFKATFSVSENWWNTGEGEMFSKKGSDTLQVREHPEDYGSGYVAAVAEMMREMDEETQKDIYLSVQKEKLLRDLLTERQDKKVG